MLDVIRWLKKLKQAIEQIGDLVYSHANRHKPGGADALFPVDYDIYPAFDNSNDLGKPSNRWRDVHIAGNLYLYNVPEVTPTE